MLVESRLHLHREDRVAAVFDDVLLAPGELHQPERPRRGEVSGTEPAVAGEGLQGAGLAVVSLHDARPHHGKLADLAPRDPPALVVDDPYAVSGHWPADQSGQRPPETRRENLDGHPATELDHPVTLDEGRHP